MRQNLCRLGSQLFQLKKGLAVTAIRIPWSEINLRGEEISKLQELFVCLHVLRASYGRKSFKRGLPFPGCSSYFSDSNVNQCNRTTRS